MPRWEAIAVHRGLTVNVGRTMAVEVADFTAEDASLATLEADSLRTD